MTQKYYCWEPKRNFIDEKGFKIVEWELLIVRMKLEYFQSPISSSQIDIL
jgi:hypothetical protein